MELEIEDMHFVLKFYPSIFTSWVPSFWCVQLQIILRSFVFRKADALRTRGSKNGHLKYLHLESYSPISSEYATLCLCFLITLYTQKRVDVHGYKVYSGWELSKKKILITLQRCVLVSESLVYNRHFKALKMCSVHFRPPPECIVLNKQNILAAFVTVNNYSKSSGEMFLSQEQYVFRILWTLILQN